MTFWLCCFGSGYNRKKLRDYYNYKGGYFRDCLLHLVCPHCMVVQEWSSVMQEEFNFHEKLIWQVMKKSQIKEENVN